MKTLRSFIIAALLLCSTLVWSQESYTVDGQTYTLKTEVQGALQLLWNTIDEEYRYFVKKGTTIVELKNTKVDGRYQEEYKAVLTGLTKDNPIDVSKVNFTLPGLEAYFNTYNKQANSDFIAKDKSVQLSVRLGVFGGVSNTIFFINPENTIIPTAGIEFELTDLERLRRHGIVIRFKQAFASSDYDFSSSELSLNYRLKFIKSDAIDVFINTKIASYIYVSRDILDTTEDPPESYSGSGGDVRVPGAFGLGADIALGNGFVTVAYNDIVALGLENNGEFPMDFTLGYKFSF